MGPTQLPLVEVYLRWTFLPSMSPAPMVISLNGLPSSLGWTCCWGSWPFPFSGVLEVDLLFPCPPFCVVLPWSAFSFPCGLLIPKLDDFKMAVSESILLFKSAVPSSLHSSTFAPLNLAETLFLPHGWQITNLHMLSLLVYRENAWNCISADAYQRITSLSIACCHNYKGTCSFLYLCFRWLVNCWTFSIFSCHNR